MKHLKIATLLLLILPLVTAPTDYSHSDYALLNGGSHSTKAISLTAKHRERWLSPVGKPYTVTRSYVPPAHKYGSGHRGIDLMGTNSNTVTAPTSGTVTFVGKVVDRHVISVQVSDSIVYSLEPVESELSVGDPVAKGQVIGNISAFGHTQPHEIHFGVRINGEYTNPLRFLTDRPKLLPW